MYIFFVFVFLLCFNFSNKKERCIYREGRVNPFLRTLLLKTNKCAHDFIKNMHPEEGCINISVYFSWFSALSMIF